MTKTYVTQTIAYELIEHYRQKGILIQFLDDTITHCIQMLVKADWQHAKNNKIINELGFKWVRASWHDSWYAQLLRWIHKRWNKLYWKLPEILRFTANGQVPNHVYRQWELPSDAFNRAIFQIYYMKRTGTEPTKAICGREAYYTMARVYHSTDYYYYPSYEFAIHGLKVIVSDWLEPNAVVVI